MHFRPYVVGGPLLWSGQVCKSVKGAPVNGVPTPKFICCIGSQNASAVQHHDFHGGEPTNQSSSQPAFKLKVMDFNKRKNWTKHFQIRSGSIQNKGHMFIISKIKFGHQIGTPQNHISARCSPQNFLTDRRKAGSTIWPQICSREELSTSSIRNSLYCDDRHEFKGFF